jgi:hypothetical protein
VGEDKEKIQGIQDSRVCQLCVSCVSACVCACVTTRHHIIALQNRSAQHSVQVTYHVVFLGEVE